MPKRSVSSVKGSAVKPKEGAELSESDSVKEGIGGLKAEADREEEEAPKEKEEKGKAAEKSFIL